MKPRTRTTFVDVIRSLINEARLACKNPNSSPAISNLLLSGRFIRRIETAKDVRRHLISIGLNKEIREYLKQEENGDNAARPTPEQLALWPTEDRQLVRDIDRARIFVPSRGEFVPLIPNGMTGDEIVEAGEYEIAMGESTIRRGRLLVRLGTNVKRRG